MIRRVLAILSPLPLLAVAAIGGGGYQTAGGSITGARVADIPPDRLALYVEAGRRYRVRWALIAAVGKVECDHGRMAHPSCRDHGQANSAGAVGPMQFLPPTWRRGGTLTTAVGPESTSNGEGYATDGNRDGLADPWEPADAIHGAARLLAANGATSPQGEHDAVFAYNHAEWYVDRVIAQAAEYEQAQPVATSSASVVVAYALAQVGKTYVFGGAHGRSLAQMRGPAPDVFDCSSLTAHAWAQAGVYIGDWTGTQWSTARQRDRTLPAVLAPGDLIFFGPSAELATHVAMVAEPGPDALLVEAPQTGIPVRTIPLSGKSSPVGWVRPGDLQVP